MPLALEGVITDITESRLAQASLERARQQATHYLEVAGVMMIALDAEGRVTLINRRGCEILGRSKQEIIGREWFSQFLRREDRERIHEVYSRLMAGELVPFEHYENQVCRYLVKDFGTSQSPKSTRQRDSRYCPDRPALITTPSRTLQQSCSCATPS
ncbi:MAG: PAS domain S-box protein [gamma proteobacterium symbiont of Phacoides pectinatus]